LFTSLISPWMLNNVRIFLTNKVFISNSRIYLKQSYLLLTWLYYLTFLTHFTKNHQKKNLSCSFFITPTRFQLYTLLKAPMAHKTYSKEQFTLCFYNIHFNFSFRLVYKLLTVNTALLFLLLTKAQFPQFETNLLFLKNIHFYFIYESQVYFNYFNCIN